MINMKTTSWGGGSRKEFSKRVQPSNKTLLNSTINHNKAELYISKFRVIFEKMGYFVPASLNEGHWYGLIPRSNPDLFPPLKVYIMRDCSSFYALNIETGALEFYSLIGVEPCYGDDSIFNKLQFGGLL